MFKGSLYPFQFEAVEAMIDMKHLLVAVEMGLGKTVMTIAAVERLIDDGLVGGGLIICPASIKIQWRRMIEEFAPEANVIVVNGTASQREEQYRRYKRGEGEYLIINPEQLTGDWEIVSKLPRDFIVADECVLEGSLVDTPQGPRRIESLGVGDLVDNAVGTGRVTAVRRVERQILTRLTLVDGRQLICSPEHPVLTSWSWLPAAMIKCGDAIVNQQEALRVVRGAIARESDDHGSHWPDCALQQEQVLQWILCSEVENEPDHYPRKNVHARASGETTGSYSKALGHTDAFATECLEAFTARWVHPGRQWARYDQSPESPPRSIAYRVGDRILDLDQGVLLDTGVPFSLQGRSRQPVSTLGRRDRRFQPQGWPPTGTGQEEGQKTLGTRVVSIEVLELGHPEFARLSGDRNHVALYDLAVEGHPSFSVQGLLVHNCTWFKNFKPQRSKKIKRLHATYHWALTGQPIENRAEEVFSIMQWVDPAVLGNFKTFDAAFIKRDYFGRVRMYRNLPTLHRLLSDHMVRRTRAEVADQLPAVVAPPPILIDADADTSKLYRRMVHDLESELAEAMNSWGNFSLGGFYRGEEQGEARGRIMSKLVCMRMLCDHPELLRLSAAHYRGVLPGTRTGSEYAEELHEAGRLEGLKRAPKLDALVGTEDKPGLIREILEAHPENKIVVFSFFKDMLDIVAEHTRSLTRSVLFTGAVSVTNRDKAKQTFATDPDTRLFLSSDAGGIGLDLPVANYLISYDLPWSSGAFTQRQSRIIRLSSKFPQVTLLTIQVAGSIEEYQHLLLQQKKKVADAVVDGKGINPRGGLSMDLRSLSEWLRESVV